MTPNMNAVFNLLALHCIVECEDCHGSGFDGEYTCGFCDGTGMLHEAIKKSEAVLFELDTDD